MRCSSFSTVFCTIIVSQQDYLMMIRSRWIGWQANNL